MRLPGFRTFVPVLSLFLLGVNAEPSQGGELYPPGYLPLVNKANTFLSVGQFNDAAKAYSEAIGMLNTMITPVTILMTAT